MNEWESESESLSFNCIVLTIFVILSSVNCDAL